MFRTNKENKWPEKIRFDIWYSLAVSGPSFYWLSCHGLADWPVEVDCSFCKLLCTYYASCLSKTQTKKLLLLKCFFHIISFIVSSIHQYSYFYEQICIFIRMGIFYFDALICQQWWEQQLLTEAKYKLKWTIFFLKERVVLVLLIQCCGQLPDTAIFCHCCDPVVCCRLSGGELQSAHQLCRYMCFNVK